MSRYDLREEFPILTIRRTYLKSAIDEILWIWQKKSNNVHELSSHIWDSWADGSGSIGKAYGYQLGIQYDFPEGRFDQVDKVLFDLKNNPASRRIIAHMYNVADLKEMHLYPCAYSMTFNVTGNTLNGILNQRSQDMLTASNWNVVQYSILLMMFARASGLEAGSSCTSLPTRTFTTGMCRSWKSCLQTRSTRAPPLVDETVTDFYRFTKESFALENYKYSEFDVKIPVAI